MVDVEREEPGHWHFSLGPVEKWIIGAAAAAILAGGYWFVASVNENNKTLQTVVTQQAVMNGQLAMIANQLSDVPSLRTTVTQNTVEMKNMGDDIKQNTAAITELRNLRGLK